MSKTIAQEERWTVGQVVAYLRRWFPDVRASQLRFWEKEGLIEAYRTKGGHRKYCPEKVERLRKILLLRRRFRLSLPETRAMLDLLDQPGGWLFLLEKGTMGILEPPPPVKKSERAHLLLESLGFHSRCPVTGQPVEEVQHLAPAIEQLIEESLLSPDALKTLFDNIRKLVDLEAELAQASGMPLESFWELLRRVRTWAHLYFIRKKLFEQQKTPHTKKEDAP